MAECIMVNTKMIRKTEEECTYGLMEEPMLETGGMESRMTREFTFYRTENAGKVNGLMG